MATPAAMGLFTRKRRVSVGASMEPMMPETITAATVTDWTPPSVLVMPMAMGVVTDLATVEMAMESERPMSSQSPQAEIIEVIEPARHPARMGMKCFLSTVI